MRDHLLAMNLSNLLQCDLNIIRFMKFLLAVEDIGACSMDLASDLRPFAMIITIGEGEGSIERRL